MFGITRIAEQRDPTGMLYFTTERRAIVVWRVAPDGQVAEAAIVESSGVSFFDHEALQCVKTWFDPPPPGMANRELRTLFTVSAPDGHVRLAGASSETSVR
jgi:TonB family protein